MAAAAGVEPATCSLGESRSIQLSYATAFRISGRGNTDTTVFPSSRIPADRKCMYIL